MLEPEDERLIEEISRSLRPRAMDGMRARAFQMHLSERLEKGEGPSRAGAFAVALAAAAAWTLWFTNPPSSVPMPTVVAEQHAPAVPEGGERPPVYALVERPLIDEIDAPEVAAEDYLPDDYLVLAAMFVEGDAGW